MLLWTGCSGQSGPEPVVSDSTQSFDDVSTPPPVDPSQELADATPPASGRPASTPAEEREPPAGAAGDRAAPAGGPLPEIVPGTSDPDTSKEPAEAPEPPRSSVRGRWEFVLSGFGQDIIGLLVDVDPANAESPVTIVDDSRSMPGWKVTQSKVTDVAAEVTFANQEGVPVDFRGTLQDGAVLGNIVYGLEGIELASLRPSRLDSLDAAEPFVPSEGIELMQGFRPQRNPMLELAELAAQFGTKPLGYETYRRVFASVRSQGTEGLDLPSMATSYLASAAPWGERVVARTHLDLAYTLAVSTELYDEAKRHLDDAAAAMSEETSPSLAARLMLCRGIVLVHGGDDAERQQGIELLRQVEQQDPFNTDAQYHIGWFEEHHGKPEQALEIYARQVALPSAGGDMDAVTRVWTKLGREPEELETYLTETYRRHIYAFAETAEQATVPPERPDQRVVLGELFTGGSCPPCVAADVATGGLEVTFPKSRFVMLRYHQHVPAPDPMTVEAGEMRSEYYRVGGTPTLCLNGQMVESVAGMYGPIFNAPAGYAELRQLIEPMIAESSQIRITARASAQNGVVSVAAAVEGVDEVRDRWRLRLCLAEDEVPYPAPNGIRLHEMLVRAMPGGAEGIAPVEGKLAYDGELTLDEIRQEVQKTVEKIGRGRPSPLPEQPLKFEHMHLVAFVQDDVTREVLQATAVPVTGLSDVAAAHVPGAATAAKPVERTEEQPSNN
jgi:hypothetical protein